MDLPQKERTRLFWDQDSTVFLEPSPERIRVPKNNTGILLKSLIEEYELFSEGVQRMQIKESFRIRFLKGLGKTEVFDGTQGLQRYTLCKPLSIRSIVLVLGDRAVIETTLTEAVFLLMSQSWNEKGPLLINSENNLFFIRDQKDKLAAVHVRAQLGFWVLNATTLEDQSKWRVGTRVFVRDPGDAISEDCLLRD